MAKNTNLHNAKKAKNDEFYTQVSDIEKEMAHYKPLNVMYWAKNEDGTYEVLDSQQRTLSLCEFLTTNNFQFSDKDKRTVYEQQ